MYGYWLGLGLGAGLRVGLRGQLRFLIGFGFALRQVAAAGRLRDLADFWPKTVGAGHPVKVVWVAVDQLGEPFAPVTPEVHQRIALVAPDELAVGVDRAFTDSSGPGGDFAGLSWNV